MPFKGSRAIPGETRQMLLLERFGTTVERTRSDLVPANQLHDFGLYLAAPVSNRTTLHVRKQGGVWRSSYHVVYITLWQG